MSKLGLRPLFPRTNLLSGFQPRTNYLIKLSNNK